MVAALLCGALLVLAGCGSSDNKGTPIPSAQSTKLINAIQAADQYSADGSCKRARTKVRDARFLLGQAPNSVDADVRRGISDGLERLDSLIQTECQRPKSTQTDTTTTETTATETTPTETTPTDTTPTETTQTQTTQTQPTTTTTVPTTTTPTTTGTGTTTTGTGGTPPPPGNGASNGDEG
jgi:hypothetical protein